jgi:hypothetical protein
MESKEENNNSSKENSFFNFFKKLLKSQEVEIYDHEKEPIEKGNSYLSLELRL